MKKSVNLARDFFNKHPDDELYCFFYNRNAPICNICYKTFMIVKEDDLIEDVLFAFNKRKYLI